MSESKYPIAIFELIQKGQGSGFIRDDTKNTPNPMEIIFPKNRALINRSVVREESEKNPGTFINVPTRYIYGCELIREADQKKENVLPNPKMDRIEFKNGLLTCAKDGATVGQYNWLKTHAQNLTNEKRLKHLDPIFKEIKPAETSHEINKNEFAIAEAVMYIRNLMTEKGGRFIFQEERVDAICNQFGIYADSYEAKIQALTAYAKHNPVFFLEESKKTEQIVLIQVQHGIKLKVIEFTGNTAMYVKKDIKIKTFSGNLSDEKKVNSLANYFQTVDGREAYELFAAELAAAKSDSLKNN